MQCSLHPDANRILKSKRNHLIHLHRLHAPIRVQFCRFSQIAQDDRPLDRDAHIINCVDPLFISNLNSIPIPLIRRRDKNQNKTK